MSLDETNRKTAVNPDNYGYATGRIRALEASLFSPADFSKLFEARQPEDISRIIQDKGYGAGDVEDSLNMKLAETYEIMQQIIPDESFIEAILLFNDCHNLKVILKYLSTWWTDSDAVEEGKQNMPESDSSLTWQGLESLIQHPSLVEPAKLFRAVRDRRDEQVPAWLYQLAKDGAAIWFNTYDTGSMDMFIDAAAWRRTMKLAEELKNDFFKGYLVLRQDLLSLEILLRCKALRTGKEYLGKALPPASSLERSLWLSAYEADESRLAEIVELLGIQAYFASDEQMKILSEYGKAGSAAVFNRIADEILANWLHKASAVLRGPEVPVSYLLRRELEIKNIRIALTCLRNGIPASQARELARAAI